MHRRQTLASADAGSSNAALPSTVSRHHARQSIIPRAGRPSTSAFALQQQQHQQQQHHALSGSQQSSGSGGAQSSQHHHHQPFGQHGVPATVGRHASTYASGQIQLGWSGARGDAGHLRSSQAPSTTVRRSSVYTGVNNNMVNRRQSAFPGAGGPMGSGSGNLMSAPGGITATPGGSHVFAAPTRQAKDPRNVRDRAFQKRAREEIFQFLEQRGYSQTPLSERTLSNPTTKDFQEIFKFIYHCFDGKQVSSLSSLQKKFEDEVPVLLRAAGYPYAADISKSHLQAIGAQHSWPGMLAMLHWFVQVIIAREQAFTAFPDLHVDPTQLDTAEAPMRIQYRTEMWAEYLASAYPQFLASEDYDIETERQRLNDRYREAGENTRAEILRNTEELERLKMEFDVLARQESTLEKHRQEQQKLDTDIHHMQEYLKRLDEGVGKYKVRSEEAEKRIGELEKEEQAAAAERERMEKVVEVQNLTEVDVQRLTTDKHTLEAKNQAANEEHAAKARRALDLEIERTRSYAAIEKLVIDYELLAAKLGLTSHPPKAYEHIDFHQRLNGSASTAAATVPDCTTYIKPAIARLKQDCVTARRDDEDRVISIQAELADLRDQIRSATADADNAEASHATLQAQLNAAKTSLNNDSEASYAELQRLQQQVASIQMAKTAGQLSDDQRLQALKNEHDRLMSDVEKLRRDNQEAFAQQLEIIVSYKQYIIARVGDMAAEVAL